MNKVRHCSVAGCGQSAAASLEAAALCRGHFIAVCYARLDDYDEKREAPGLNAAEEESVRRFILECTQQAVEIENAAEGLDNLERAKLLDVILSASELGRRLRRSPRKTASVAVRLSSNKLGGTWEELTETVVLSRHGASVRCTHGAKPGEILDVVRSDTGQKVKARVAWQRVLGQGDVRIGIEFVDCENFWDLDWDAARKVRSNPKR